MELLDDYKKVWKNQPEDENKLSKEEIYKFAHSKSSSLVKWIFIIGIVEFLFWIAMDFVIPDSYYDIVDHLNLNNVLNIYAIIHYTFVIVFLIYFYKNYKNISVIQSTKKLIKDILKVRKTVKYYVYFNLLSLFLGSLVLNIMMFSDAEKLSVFSGAENLSMDLSKVVTVTFITQLLILLIALLLLWLFYRLIYGVLLKKLNKNHNELIRLENEINV